MIHDYPNHYQLPRIPIFHHLACGKLFNYMGPFGSGAWGTANLAVFFPFFVSIKTEFDRMAVYNGSTTIAGNFDMGIYDMTGNRLASTGSTAQSGASTIQYANLTAAVALDPGRYLMAFAADDATATYFRNVGVHVLQKQFPIYSQTSAFALPNPATLAIPSANLITPCFAALPTGAP